MNTSNAELRSPNKDFSDQPTEEHGITGSSGDESLTPSEDSTISKSMCKVIGCHIQSNDYTTKCNLSLPYECTRLPAYQLYLFTRKNYRLFICDTCIIGEIPCQIIEHSIDNKENTSVNERLREKVKTLEGHQQVLRQHIKDQEKLLNVDENSSRPRMVEHKSTQSDSDTENAEIKLANEKLLEEKEKLETELAIRVSEFSRLSDEKNKQTKIYS